MALQQRGWKLATFLQQYIVFLTELETEKDIEDVMMIIIPYMGFSIRNRRFFKKLDAFLEQLPMGRMLVLEITDELLVEVSGQRFSFDLSYLPTNRFIPLKSYLSEYVFHGVNRAHQQKRISDDRLDQVRFYLYVNY